MHCLSREIRKVSLPINKQSINSGKCCCDWNEGLASDLQFPLA
jgi:hypothetical protein